MEIETKYMENLPSANYKTRQFQKSIRQTIPDDSNQEAIADCFCSQQAIVEEAVLNDVERWTNFIEEMKG